MILNGLIKVLWIIIFTNKRVLKGLGVFRLEKNEKNDMVSSATKDTPRTRTRVLLLATSGVNHWPTRHHVMLMVVAFVLK